MGPQQNAGRACAFERRAIPRRLLEKSMRGIPLLLEGRPPYHRGVTDRVDGSGCFSLVDGF